MYLGRKGTTKNFSVSAVRHSVTLHPGDVIAYCPYIMHGCEAMSVDDHADGILLSLYVNALNLRKLGECGYAGRYAWG